MRQPGTFWGIVLIAVGTFLLLSRLGLLAPGLLRLAGPLALVAVGVWVLWSALHQPAAEPKSLSVQLKGIEEATVRLRFGGGELSLGGGAAPDELLEGRFSAGVEHTADTNGDQATLTLRTPYAVDLPFGARGNQLWDIRLNDALPIHLDLALGGGTAALALTDTQVRTAKVEVAGGKVELEPPAAAGHVAIGIRVTGGEVVVSVPPELAADIRAEELAVPVEVDTTRFPRFDGGFRSAGYEGAEHRVELRIETVAGSIAVR